MKTSSLKDKLINNKFISDFLSASSIKQFKRYLITGFLSFGIEYALFYLIHKILMLEYLIANVIVYALVFWINFLLNRFWSFNSNKNFLRQLKLYFALFIFNLFAANILLMYLLTDIAGINSLISKIFVMGSIVSWNFILYKKVIYK